MSPRRISLILLLAAALLVLLIVVWSRENRTSTATEANRSVARLPEDPATPSPAPPSAEAPPNPLSQRMRIALQRIAAHRDARPQEAVLTFADAAAYRRFLARAQHHGLSVLGQIDALLTVRVRYDSLAALEAELRENLSDYADISANNYIRIPDVPVKADRAYTDPIPFRNSTLAFLGAANDRSAWGRGTTIAILDTGVAPDATFGGDRVQYLNIGLGTLPGSGAEDGHGTAVAALAAGLSPDAAGVAPAASLLSIRVTDTNGLSDIFSVAQAILAAVDARAAVINLSLGGYATTPALNYAIDYAVAHGSVIVAAAGNDQASQLVWPAADPRVISVGAVDALGQQVAFSNSGPQLQIAAPGYGVQTAWLDSQRVYVNGTSASAPLVAGAIAAVMSQTPGATADQAWAVIKKTVSDAGAPGPDPDYGNGILNLDWAMNAANPAHVDPAIATHFYDSSAQQMDIVVQNRSVQSVSGLTLDVATNGESATYRLPDIAGGASYVLALPIDPSRLSSANGLSIRTQLIMPVGLTDANVTNNQLSSRLVAPIK